MEIFKLFGSIFVDKSEADKKIEDTGKKAESFGEKLGKGIGTAVKWGAAITGAVGTMAGAVMGVATQVADAAGDIDDMSQRAGTTAEEFQKYAYAAKLSGMETATLEKAMIKSQKSFADAKEGSKAMSEAYARLGIDINNIGNSSDAFDATLAALADMEDETQRNAIANDLFGKSYADLAPLLNQGSDGIAKLKQEAVDLGGVMSDETIAAGAELGDTIDKIKTAAGGLVNSFGALVIPLVQTFADFILKKMPLVQGILMELFGGLSGAVEAALPFLMNLVQTALPPLITIFTEIVTNLLPPLISLFSDIIGAVLPPFMELLTGIIQTLLPPLMDLLGVIISQILPPFIELFNNVINAVLPPLMELLALIIDTLLPPLIELFTKIIDAVMPVLIELFDQFTKTILPPLMELIEEVVKVILPPLLDLFTDLAETVLPLVMTIFKAMQPVIESAMKIISSVITTVLALIKGDWEGVWSGIESIVGNTLDFIENLLNGWKEILGGIFEGIANLVLGIWDGMVNGIKGGINWIIKGINAFISGINTMKIPDWVPGVGGLAMNLPTIPLLANGGQIMKGGAAIVGDAGPELLELPQGATVSPLKSNILEELLNAFGSLREAFANMQMGGELNVVLNMDGRETARVTSPWQAMSNSTRARFGGA